jgi:hypothetical protein
LLDLMLESIEAEIEPPEPSGDWRADLRAFARRTRAAMSRHRWALEFIGSRPPSGRTTRGTWSACSACSTGWLWTMPG